jgi:pimeloyl-ACP methyl ester carboxylesterase
VGKPKPLLDGKRRPLTNSISEKIWVDINGVRQGMFIESQNAASPVLLMVHGGPGMPDHFLTKRYPTGLDRLFMVVWWEQRGTGLSYSVDIPPKTMTVDQFVSDILAVTNYLRSRFAKEKIYLMGHSWGSFIGIQAAARAPELYYAYIGMAQMSYQLESERLAYEFMLERFKQKGDMKMVRKLEEAPVTLRDGTRAEYLALRDTAMHSLGIGTTHDMKSVISGIFIPSWLTRDSERKSTCGAEGHSPANLASGTSCYVPISLPRCQRSSFRSIFSTVDTTTRVLQFGEAVLPEARRAVEGGAHSPVLEEAEKAQSILRQDVLAGSTALADAT